MPNRVHHLSCGTMCPYGGRLLNDDRHLVAHVLLVETPSDGLLLVDTGFGTDEVDNPKLVPTAFRLLSRPVLSRDETAAAHVEALGYSIRDVQHVVVTHLDIDHAGGIPDFPWATLHVHARELDAALHPESRKERARYLERQFARHDRTETYADAGDDFFGLEAVRELGGISGVALIPTHGHSRGHSAVAVEGADGRWLVHAGDAYFHPGEMEDPPHCSTGLKMFQAAVQMDKDARVHNQARLRELALGHPGEVRVFSAHDPSELRALAESADAAAGPV